MSKFTKGEWRVQMTETQEGRNVLEVVTNAFDVCCYRLGIRNKHDAHLIAAAPEMYRFIGQMLEEDVLYCGNDTVAMEILAKARGEEL